MVNFYYWISKIGRIVFPMIFLCLPGQEVRAQTLGTNIILNGDAEGASGVVGNPWVDFSSAPFGDASGTDGGPWYLTNSSSYPSAGSPMQSHGGSRFFNAGIDFVSSTDTRTLTQDINVSAFAGQDLTYTFSGWVATNGTFLGDANLVEVKIEYLDGGGGNVGTPYDNIYVPSSSTFTGWFNITDSRNVLATDAVQSVRITLSAQNINTSSTIQAYFDDLSLVPTATTLPVTLMDLHALLTPDRTVALQWETAQEQNSNYMEVQRSANGKTFAGIGQVAAAGNSSLPSVYSFTDKSPLQGKGFYRLKLVDRDGSFTYSKVLQITTGGLGADIKVYSNPFHDQLGILIPAVSSEKLALSLLDQSGRVCLRQNYTTQRGDNFVNLYPVGMASGVYLLHIQGAKTDRTIRVLKQ